MKNILIIDWLKHEDIFQGHIFFLLIFPALRIFSSARFIPWFVHAFLIWSNSANPSFANSRECDVQRGRIPLPGRSLHPREMDVRRRAGLPRQEWRGKGHLWWDICTNCFTFDTSYDGQTLVVSSSTYLFWGEIVIIMHRIYCVYKNRDSCIIVAFFFIFWEI